MLCKLLVILCSFIAMTATAQVDRLAEGGNQISDPPQGSVLDTVQPDLKYTYFTVDDMQQEHTYADTSLDQRMHHYDEVYRRADPYINLGNNGSAHKPLMYTKTIPMALDFGHHEYDLYRFGLEDLRMYTVNRPIADLSFSSQGGRQNFVVAADFSRPFSDGIQTNIQYRRIAQDGYYSNQATRHTNLGLSFWYRSPSDKYSIVTSFINNTETAAHNGGVLNIETIERPSSQRRDILPVFLNDATSRYEERHWHTIQTLALTGSRSGFSVKAQHHLDAGSGLFRYADSNVDGISNDSVYLSLIPDDRGLRYETAYSRISNAVSLLGDKAASNLKLRIGLRHDYTRVDRRPGTQQYNDVFATGSAELPWRGQQLSTQAWIGLGNAAGTFDVSGELKISPVAGLELYTTANIYRHRPSLLSEDLIVTQQSVWSYDWANPFGTILSGELRIPKWNLSAHVGQTVETNTLFYNELALPDQLEQVFSASVLSVEHGLRLGPFGLDNFGMIQTFSNNVFRMPAWTTRHNLWWQGYVFRGALLARLGAEATLVPSHAGAAFMPLTGQFYQDPRFSVDFYPNVDIYMTTQISSFRAFFKFENFANYFMPELPIYVKNHPQFDARFRLGVRWLLKD